MTTSSSAASAWKRKIRDDRPHDDAADQRRSAVNAMALPVVATA